MFATCIGCRFRPQPATVYEEIEQQFQSGYLTIASEESEKAYVRFLTGRPDWAATFRLELAKVLIYQGKSVDAMELLQQPLPGNLQIQSEVKRKLLLSIAQARLGHVDQAQQNLEEAQRQCSEETLRTEVFGARGSVDMVKGDFEDAERQFQASLAGARVSNNQFLQMQSLLNLGYAALGEEHYEDALSRFSSASVLARSIGAKLALEKILGNIGWVYYKTGDFERSLPNYKEAEAEATELGASIDQVRWLNTAGLSEYRLGDLDAARSFYERSLGLARSIQNKQEMLDAHVDLAFLLLKLRDLRVAEINVREANGIAALMQNDRAALEPALLNALLLEAKGDKQGASKQLLAVEKHAVSVPSLQWEAESNLARIYSQEGRPADADHWFRRSIGTFQRQRSSLSNVESTLPFLANGSELYASYMEHLVDRDKPIEALRIIDQSRAESLADGLRLPPAQVRRLSSRGLNAKSIAARVRGTILVYCLRPKTSYLWAITPTGQQFYRLAGSEIILPLMRLHTKMILSSKDLLSESSAPGKRLYNELIEPAQNLIKKNRRVFIVADEALSGLNFETLQTPGGNSHYWIEDVTITNAKSLQLLSVKPAKRARFANRRILLMGDAVYRKDEYAELPNASTEIKNIESHFSPDRRTVFTGVEASPESYQLSNAGQFSYIHFVAHGTANVTVPLDSAVVLSSNRDGVTYKLYARDILEQNLREDLVSVSACNGSGVRNYSGEGLVGLAWAFLRAGSHHVIGAMWEVSDISTPLLMDHLYGALAMGSQPDAALRSAKLSLIHSDGVFRKPLYWAPFQLYSGA